MHELPTEWTALAAIVFLLGLKHGFDADHLATIDGLTRFNARSQQRWARLCGVLFSLGHGAVVMVIALAVGYASERWTPPEWLDLSGTLISLGFSRCLGLSTCARCWPRHRARSWRRWASRVATWDNSIAPAGPGWWRSWARCLR